MCRMVAIVSSKPQAVSYELMAAPFSLLWLSQHGKQPYSGEQGRHDQGWGLAWREEGAMKLVKKGNPADQDMDFERWAERITTDRLIAHIRKASDSNTVCDANAHPFEEGGLCLAHNGDVRLGAPGEVDSKALLHWIVQRWDKDQDSLVSLLREASTSLRYTSLSFLMTDGERVYAFRQVRNEPRFLNYYTLFLKQSDEKVVVSSEPLDEGPWHLLANGELVILGEKAVERMELT